MNFEENKVYHIYNRGNNQQQIFFDDENYKLFLKKLKVALNQHCELLTYCLMPNHFHLQVFIKQKFARNKYGKDTLLNDNIAILLRSYTRVLQLERGFKGSLFQQKTKAKEVFGEDDLLNCDYIKTCAQYIHQNPLKAGLVKDLHSWPYSSFHEYCGNKKECICNKELFYQLAKTQNINFLIDNERVI
jgi:putative transposase